MPLESVLTGLEDQSIDIGVAAFTVTADREERLIFHPFYSDGLAIAARESEESIFIELLKRFVSIEFISAVSALLALLLVFGVLIWLLERKANPEQFGGKLFTGIGNGPWGSAVTRLLLVTGIKHQNLF